MRLKAGQLGVEGPAILAPVTKPSVKPAYKITNLNVIIQVFKSAPVLPAHLVLMPETGGSIPLVTKSLRQMHLTRIEIPGIAGMGQTHHPVPVRWSAGEQCSTRRTALRRGAIALFANHPLASQAFGVGRAHRGHAVGRYVATSIVRDKNHDIRWHAESPSVWKGSRT
jgi:hypothetical protein